ncbi:MAG: leucine-rich repeat domain-containing protein, partial [Clostridiales bacterium]|nr:leucine-rich repeat domain-containing protein [Clostridiales bacterium]
MKKHRIMHRFRKALAVLLTFCLVLSLAPAALADDATSGTCGENVTWTLDTDTGVLTISGTGDMADWSTRSDVPWYSYRRSISAVTIDEGVTSIGIYAFYHCTGLTDVTIPDSVTTIGDRAFYNCTGLTSVTIGSGVTSIGSRLFYN